MGRVSRIRPPLHSIAVLCALFLFAGLAAARADDKQTCAKETDPQRAIAACTRVIASAATDDRDLVTAYLNRGLSYRDAGDQLHAVADFSAAIEREASNARAYYLRGLAYNDLAEYDRALQDLAQAERLDPNDPDAINARGWVFIDTGRYAEALMQFDRAVALDSDERFFHNNRAVALTELGRCADALAAVETALEMDDKYGNAIVNHGVALACLGRRVEAMAEFNRAIILYPDNPQITNAIAWKLSKSDRPGFRGDPFPLEMAQRSVALADTHAYRDTLAAALANAGRLVEAVAAERRALDMAKAAGETGFVAQYSRRLAVYESGKPLTE